MYESWRIRCSASSAQTPAPMFLLLALSLFGAPNDTVTSALNSDIRTILSAYTDGVVAVSVRDPEHGVTIDIRGNRLFHAASTMKVPVMIEVYQRAKMGHFSVTDSLLVVNEFRSIADGSAYSIARDSDDAIYERLGTGMAIRDLVYQMITVSSNLATNLLIDLVSPDSVQLTIERLGTTSMDVRRGVEDMRAFELGLNNTATSADLATLLLALAEGRAVTPADDAEMVSIMEQQTFREMIPAGLPGGIRVANKTGFISSARHDAAIVFTDDHAPYVLVVLTEGITDHSVVEELTYRIAAATHARLRG
jgi:beta-lactamase class A